MLISTLFLTATLLPCGQQPVADVGGLVRALWLIQQSGEPAALSPSADRSTKGMLSKALAGDQTLSFAEIKPLMDVARFQNLAGSDGVLDAGEVIQSLAAGVPESREALAGAVRDHAAFLSTTYDMIDPDHERAGALLVDWIVENYQPGKPLDVIAVCTGNSRRSMMTATMGNVAASYYGLPELRFHSGGTEPSAMNSRTITALRSIGVTIEPTGEQAPSGATGTSNPVYRLRWGTRDDQLAVEFSKHYTDAANPQRGFAALMVCGEADAGCPVVKGASTRISMPYLDPKIYDDGAYEAAKYSERLDDIGRLMLSVVMQASNRIRSAGETSRSGE